MDTLRRTHRIWGIAVMGVLALLVNACTDGPNTSTGLTVSLPADFTANVSHEVPFIAHVNSDAEVEPAYEWSVTNHPPGATFALSTIDARMTSLAVSVEGVYSVRVDVSTPASAASAVVNVTFSADNTFPPSSRLSPAPYLVPETRTIAVTDPDSGEETSVDVAVFGEYVAFGDFIVATLDDAGASTLGTYRGASLFPSNVIAYAVHAEVFTTAEVASITNALDSIAASTILEFEEVEAGASTPKMYFTRGATGALMGAGCWAAKTPIILDQFRVINLGSGTGDCIDRATIVHEVVHAIGFFHEHQRNDRDEHVELTATSQLGPAHPSWVLNFQQPWDNVDHGPYDWESIMHYWLGDYGFATMTAREPDALPVPAELVGFAHTLSAGDIAAINALYGGVAGAYVLSSAPGGVGQIGVDDDMDVYLNDTAIYLDPSPYAGPSFGPLVIDGSPGDALRVVVTNNFQRSCAWTDVYLTTPSGDVHQILAAWSSQTDCIIGVVADVTFVLP